MNLCSSWISPTAIKTTISLWMLWQQVCNSLTFPLTMLWVIFQLYLLVCLTVAKRTGIIQFFRSYSQIWFLVFLAGGLDWWVWSPLLLSQFAQEKMFIPLENGQLYSSSQSISKTSPVTFKGFLEAVTKLVQSVDAIVFKLIGITVPFLIKALSIQTVYGKTKMNWCAFVRLHVVRNYGHFKKHHLVFCIQKNLRYFCRKAGILIGYSKIH